MKTPRLLLLGLVSVTATGLVIGGAFRDDHRADALAAAAALSRAAAVAPAVTAAPVPVTQSAPSSASRHPSERKTAPQTTATETSAPAVSTPAPTPTPHHNAKANPAPPSTPTSSSKVKHVFLISLAVAYDPTAAYAGQQLRPQGELLSGYQQLPAASDLPSYIAMVSGQPPNAQTSAGCTTYSEFPNSAKVDKKGVVSGAGCVYPVSTLTFADQLTSARHTWRAYLEGMDAGGQPTATCLHPQSGQPDDTQQGRPGDEYAARHNPFVYFHSLLDLGDCAQNDVPLTKLAADLASAKTTGSFSYIAPNLCHDGSEPTCADGSVGGTAAADAFLSQLVPQILASPAYKKNGLLEVAFSSGALLVSPLITAGSSDPAGYNPYSLLRTNEDIFGVTHLAEAAGTEVKSFGGGLVTGAGD
ncbi:MAG TPA: hypothetical protein VGF74_09000 [Thermoleophilaceae bacterium]